MTHQIRSIAAISETSPTRAEPAGVGESDPTHPASGAFGTTGVDAAESHPGACAAGVRGAGSGRVLPARGRRVIARDVQRIRRVDRRPLVGRPGGTPVRYERVRVAPRRRTHAPSPAVRLERAQVGFAISALAALVTALFVVAMLLLAQWRAGTPAPSAPTHHGLVESPHSSEHVSPLMW